MQNIRSNRLNDKTAYSVLCREIECVSNRATCDKECTHCKFYIDKTTLDLNFNYLKSILKARSPELYFAEQLIELENKIGGNNE